MKWRRTSMYAKVIYPNRFRRFQTLLRNAGKDVRWRNDKTRSLLRQPSHQPPTPDDNNWVTRIDRESSV